MDVAAWSEEGRDIKPGFAGKGLGVPVSCNKRNTLYDMEFW